MGNTQNKQIFPLITWMSKDSKSVEIRCVQRDKLEMIRNKYSTQFPNEETSIQFNKKTAMYILTLPKAVNHFINDWPNMAMTVMDDLWPEADYQHTFDRLSPKVLFIY